MTNLTVQANRAESPKPRREKLEGREHLVVPVVALVEGVFNGALHPLSEIQTSAPAWNGVPIVVYHPKRDGTPISANSPDVIEKSAIGRLFNVNMDGAALKGELWVDIAKAKQLGGDALRALEWLEAGKPLEVSTGFFSATRTEAGTFGGKNYSGIRTNHLPDHIAVLPGTNGACSWADGCGAPRVNEDATLFDRIKAAIVDGFRGLKLQTNEKEKAVEKKEIVDRLIANEATKFEETHREWLTTLSEEQLTVLCPAEKPAPKAEEKPAPAALSAEDREVLELGRRTLAAEKTKKATLVKQLVENKANRLPEATLATLSIEDLEAYAETLTPNDYSGRRRPETNETKNEKGYVPMPPIVLAKVEDKSKAA